MALATVRSSSGSPAPCPPSWTFTTLRFFTPYTHKPCGLQAALATVQSYPWSCSLPAIVNAVAQDCGEPSVAELLAQG